MKEHYDVFIAGSGLGGLLSAAYLSKKGYKVFLAEKLGYLGGRFTSFDHDGVMVPTGAVHMITHGSRGRLGQILLKDLSLDIEIKDTSYFASWQWANGNFYKHNRFWGILRAVPSLKQT